MPLGKKSLLPEERAAVARALAEFRAGYRTQLAAATALGVSQQTLSHVAKGGAPGVELAQALARHTGVSLEALIGGRRAEWWGGDALPLACKLTLSLLAGGIMSEAQAALVDALQAVIREESERAGAS